MPKLQPAVQPAKQAPPARPLALRLAALGDLLGTLLQPCPSAWLGANTGLTNHATMVGGMSESPSLTLRTCESYSELVKAWRKAMKWSEGLDTTLSVMLASSMSTQFLGEQLWIKIIGPPSCLDRETPIYDPVDNSTKSVEDRWRDGKKFFVWSRKQDGTLGISQALPPERLGVEQIYEVELESGTKVAVTSGHLIWNGVEYVEVKRISARLLAFGEYRLPSISGHSLLALRPSVLRLKKTIPDCQDSYLSCLCPYGERPLQDLELDRETVPLLVDVLASSTYSGDALLEHEHIRNFPSFIGKVRSCRGEQALRLVHHSNESSVFSSQVSVLKVPIHCKVDLLPLSITDRIVSVKPVHIGHVYDFSVPETKNYWACGMFHHNCGKTSLMEGLATARKWYLSKDTIRGFHSGYKTDDGKDVSLAQMVKGMTLGTKDGDTLLKAPNLKQILAEGRALYDKVSRTNYRNDVNREYTGHRMTWHLAGTSALREIDDSELGARFLDVVVMDKIEDEFEEEVGWRAANQEARNMLFLSDGKPESQHPEELAEAMALTGGYLDFLRVNALGLARAVKVEESVLNQCNKFGKFTAFMRARAGRDGENAEREFSARLVKQLTRLAISQAVVLNKEEVDDEVLARVHKVVIDTSRGHTLDLMRVLSPMPQGCEVRAMTMLCNQNDDKMRLTLRFLRRIGIVETDVNHRRWRVVPRFNKLYREVDHGN